MTHLTWDSRPGADGSTVHLPKYSEEVVVRPALNADVKYIDHLRRRNSEALGFLPVSRYEAAATGCSTSYRPGDRLWVVEVNADRVGYLFLTGGRLAGAAKIIQVAVQQDARRLEYASALVATAEEFAVATGRSALSLAVAADLEASSFWSALGYVLRFQYRGGERRGRLIERRHKLLPSGLWGNEEADATSLRVSA